MAALAATSSLCQARASAPPAAAGRPSVLPSNQCKVTESRTPRASALQPWGSRAVLGSTFVPAPSPSLQSCGPLHRSLRSLRGSCPKVSAEYRDSRGGGSGFLAGFVLGGVVGGALAWAFAPQLSKTLLGENADGSLRKLPKWLGEDDSLEATRKKMNEKLAELNRAIDRTSAEILGEVGEEPERRPDSRAVESIDAI